MICTELIAARVTPEVKARFRALALHEQLSESALLKRTIEMALLRLTEADAATLMRSKPRVRSSRFSVRIAHDDLTLLEARAEGRGMPAATYASVLLRSHLRGLAPLPIDELRTMKASVAELAAVGRNLNQIARHLNQGSGPERVSRDNLIGLLRICEALRDHTKALIRANVESWDQGHATPV